MKILQKFMGWYQGDNDVEREPPRSGGRRVWYLIINFGTKLILVNLLFLLCCVPVVTIPAAITALNRYLIKMFRQGYGFALSDFTEELKASFRKMLLPGALVGGLYFYAYYLMSLSGNFAVAGQQAMVMGIGAGVLVVAILMGSYIFMLGAALELPARHLVKNSFILMLCEWKSSILLVMVLLGLWFLMLTTVPYCVFVLLLCYFPVQQLILCAILMPVIERRILIPYQQQNEKSVSVSQKSMI